MDQPRPSPFDPWLVDLAARSESGRLLLALDWSATPLGDPSGWPRALRTAVALCLGSRFPVLVLWGPELVKIYNDGYRAMLGTEKHPAALGSPAELMWPEVWDVIGPMFTEVMTTGEPTWSEHMRLVIDRNGFPEECFFTFSYSPLFDEDGTVTGVLDISTETTDMVVAQRRLGCLTELRHDLIGADDPTAVYARAAASLARWSDDVVGLDLHLRVDDRLVRMSSTRRDVLRLPDEALWQVATTRVGAIVGQARPGGPARHHLVPITGTSDSVEGVLVASLNPLVPFDASFAHFVDTIGSTVGTCLDSAVRRVSALGEYRLISETLQAAILRPADDLTNVAARYVPAVGTLAVGGDWYDVIETAGGRRAIVVGDCVGHGIQAASAMAQLRSAARALVLEGHDPAAVLEKLDVFAASVPGALAATVVCLVVDGGSVAYALAGHPPPLLLGVDGHARWLDDAVGPPLAVVDDLERHGSTAPLIDGEPVVLVAYTDGLIERRDASIDDGLARLARVVRSLVNDDVHDIADALLARMEPPADHDDIVVVVVREDGSPAGDG